MHLDHGHISGMCNGLIEAGGELVAVHDPQPVRVAAFQKKFPQAKAAASEAAILDDPTIRLVAAAAVPCDRGPLGCRDSGQAGREPLLRRRCFGRWTYSEKARENEESNRHDDDRTAELARRCRETRSWFDRRWFSDAAHSAQDRERIALRIGTTR